MNYRANGKFFFLATCFFGYCLAGCSRNNFPVVPVEPGVSLSLAEYRMRVVDSLTYDLQLTIPDGKEGAIEGEETISFLLRQNNQPLQLDFKESGMHLKGVQVNGQAVPIVLQNEHLVLDSKFLKKGPNTVHIQFVAGNLSLNRNRDYLYTLLVPDRARTVFPCFDQPDLKARFQLSLTLPGSWKALSNASLIDSTAQAGKKTYRFAPSDRISTYLFSFVAGRFEQMEKKEGVAMQFLHRESDSSKLRHSREPIFQLHEKALRYLEEYTGILYPFQKFDFAAIPDFQYGGMEHSGAIQYKAASLFLDSGATREEELNRANLIAHETAHMWFGNLVTMRWFNDVWMKEVFANFMADKVTQSFLPATSDHLKFLLNHIPAAYSVDRTAGANPIRQPLQNLQEAGTLYGNIIYHKAPVVMRQLENIMGADRFQKGIREYLNTYAQGNASWLDLIRILDRHTTHDLKKWNKAWVEEPGRPRIAYSISHKNNVINKLLLTQTAEEGSNKTWPQVFDIALVYSDHEEVIRVSMEKGKKEIRETAGKPMPSYLLFNARGQGYGLFPLDSSMMTQKLPKDALLRASAYINLYENMLSGRFPRPQKLLAFYLDQLAVEPEELNLRLITGQLGDVFWRLLSPQKRGAWAPVLEKTLWEALQKEPGANKKKVLFRTYQSIALTTEAQDRLYRIWKKEQPPAGVILTEEDYTNLALALAVRDSATPDLFAQQQARISNPDRKSRLEFIRPALSANAQERDAFFASLGKEENREKEAWVITALTYLHHPLRRESSQKYILPSLQLLEEIQKTGDIFFPASWLSATLGSYQNKEAAAVVRQFLKEHPAYNPKLKAKILQAADGLFRAVDLNLVEQ